MIKKITLFFVILFFVSCGEEQNSQKELKIAQQYGLQYAPLYVANELGILKENLKNYEIKTQNFAGGAAITEALIGGHLDIGCMGIPPALIAMDKGANFKIAFGLSVPPSALVTMDKNIKSLKDFKTSDKIAVPGVGSIQHIMLSMGAKEFLGDAHYFDKSLVTMKNPEAFAALTNSTDIKAHFASLPYLAKEISRGGADTFNANDIGLKASIICVASKEFYENDKNKGLIKSTEQALELINKKDLKALEIIAKTEKISVDEAKELLDYENSEYSSKVYGLKRLYEYMKEASYLKKSREIESFLWDKEVLAQ